MKVKREWADEQQLFEEVTDILYARTNDWFSPSSSVEQGPYQDRGTITIKRPDGRRFQLELYELL